MDSYSYGKILLPLLIREKKSFEGRMPIQKEGKDTVC